MKTTPRTAFLLCLTTAATLAGCGSSVDVEDPRLGEAQAELFRAQSCEDLGGMLREDALARIDRQMDAYLLMADQFDDQDGWDGWGGEEDAFQGGDDMAGGDAESGDVAASGTGPGGGPTSGANDGDGREEAPPEHSDTNNQVEGVDEADIVKTDGERLYVLSGTSFTILQAWPASALAVEQSLALEGTPIEMFVEGDKAVIFAQVDGTAIYDAAGVTPKAPYYPSYGGAWDGGMAGDCYDCYGPQNLLTQVLVLDLAGGAPSVEREYFFEGSYLSSRREAEQVRVVLSGGAHMPGAAEYPMCDEGCSSSEDWIEAVEEARQRAKAQILSSSLEDYVAVRFERAGGAVTQLDPGCAGYWVPTAGSSEYGLTQIESLDLGNLASAPRHTAIVGAAQTVYANESTMVLAGASYDTSRFIGSGIPVTEPTILNSTFLHRFDLDQNPADPTYTGTTAVPGYVIDQFALDEREGVLRVATHVTRQTDTEWTESNGLYTIDAQANWVVGRVENLAEGEMMYSARFVGDRGYFVTFRQTDPLFVFDLADPTAPVKTGELHIPGFSEYMHPIDDGKYLLTIGQDGTLDGTNGQLALQIFDVQNATLPILKHKLPLEAGSSEALYNHKAFSFWKDMLAIPFESWDSYDGSYSAELALFSIDVEAGISEIGRVDHSQFFDIGDEYSWCYPGGVRRGVFIEDFLYSVSSGGVAVHEVDGLAPVASVGLPDFDAQAFCDGYYY